MHQDTMIQTLHKSSVQGKRETNEDCEKYKINLNFRGMAFEPQYAPVDCYVLCDGHGGAQVAKFCAVRLVAEFTRKKNIFPLPKRQVQKIFNTIQNDLINHPKNIGKNCGCTALCIVLYLDNEGNKCIQVSNIGDSRAVLCRKGLPVPLTKDHKPSWPEERLRISMVNASQAVGGPIRDIHFTAGDWRVGDLSVSRSFGDLDNTPQVTHSPESFTYQLLPTDEFIIMACDGLWDVVENYQAVNFVKDHLQSPDGSTPPFYRIPGKFPPPIGYANKNIENNIARKLSDYAVAKGSTDNVSAFVIEL